MSGKLRHVPENSVITGWDFSTTAMKCLAFDVHGTKLAEVRIPTKIWKRGDVRELSLEQIRLQAEQSVTAMADKLRDLGRLQDWLAGGISATHHTAGRIDAGHEEVRRAICWHDQSLGPYHTRGLKRLGGDMKVRNLIGGPWAVRYTLSHLVKDETELSPEGWRNTERVLSHGSLAVGYLTGNFDACSVSSAASTGIMDLRTMKWRREMLDALANEEYRDLAWQQLPPIMLDPSEPVGSITEALAAKAGLDPQQRPLVFPTSDDQQAGLVGGGAVDAGQMAIILGSSAVVNSSSNDRPKTKALDVMRLNWGPYLWMRCYTNGAQFLDKVVGRKPNWKKLEALARDVPAGCDGVMVLPFVYSEPSIGVKKKRFRWLPRAPRDSGVKARAALEALAYLIALGVKQHQKGGHTISRITVSGGIAQNDLMCEILATVLDQPLYRLVSNEGPALGAAVTALAALENQRRREQHYTGGRYPMAEAVAQMVKFQEHPVEPNSEWKSTYQKGLRSFRRAIGSA